MGNRRKLSLTGQWQFWSSFLRMSLTGQVQFLLPLGMGYHRKLSLIGQWQFRGVDTVDQGAPLQTVIDRSMTILACIGYGLSQKIVIYWSMTIFWQPWSHWELLKAENHSTLWTHHLWPYVIDHSQWQKLMDKAQKSVIDPGQWQKNCHWPWSMTKKIVIDWKVSI